MNLRPWAIDSLRQPVAAAQPERVETVEEHIKNGLQILACTDPIKDSPLDVHRALLAVEARLMKALQGLEGR